MFWAGIFGISCVLLSVSCAPQRIYWSSDESEEEPRTMWVSPRRSPYPQYGSFSDELTQMLDELQKSLINTRVAAPQFPTFAVSSSTGDDDEGDADTSVSISGTGFGTGLGGFFNSFGGFDTKNLKNKTTVKTEFINGHKVTVKESTYVSDNDGFKSVIHLSEVDMGETDSDSNDKPKTSTPKTDEEGVEDTEDKDNEDKPKEETSTSKSNEEKTEEPAVPESPEVNTKTTTEKNDSDNDEDNETLLNRWNKNTSTEKTNNPDSEVEEIETLGKDSNNYYNYNTIDKLKAAKEVGKKKTA